MPISANVGLSRKSSRDYQSQGQSINLTAELDSALLARPAELQRQIAALYRQAQEALDRAATGLTGEPVKHPKTNGHVRVNGQSASRFHSPGNGNNGMAKTGSSEPSLTASQRRAIESITRRNQIDAQTEAMDEFGCRVEELSIKQASTFIDGLLQLHRQGNGKVGAR